MLIVQKMYHTNLEWKLSVPSHFSESGATEEHRLSDLPVPPVRPVLPAGPISPRAPDAPLLPVAPVLPAEPLLPV